MKPINATSRPAPVARFYDAAPDRTDADGTAHWALRAGNFVVVVTRAVAGSVLERSEQPDEYMVLLPEDLGATLQAGNDTVTSGCDSLTIMPPGSSRVTVARPGYVYRVFSHRAADILSWTFNATEYEGVTDVAPLQDWPEPVGGFRLRHYVLAEYVRSDSPVRLFRSTNLMVNVFVPTNKPRDVRKLSPHSHDDFEQGSLTLSGKFVHHLRWPWTPDMTAWREDEHVQVGSPSLIVMPPDVIHTSQTLEGERIRLVDIFSPPRADFSLKPGLVCNAEEYPLPEALRGKSAPAGAA
jgi:hypothetical protein